MPRFPPEIPGGYPVAQIGFCKNHVLLGTKCLTFPKSHKFVPGNFRNFREFPGISGISANSVQKRPFFIDVYNRLQPENKKNPEFSHGIFRGFSGNSRYFPEFPEILRSFSLFSRISGKRNFYNLRNTQLLCTIHTKNVYKQHSLQLILSTKLTTRTVLLLNFTPYVHCTQT